MPKWLFSLIIVILVLNSLMLARSVDLLNFPGEFNELEIAQKGALHLVTYCQNLAKERNLTDNTSVRESIAKLKYEIERAKTAEEVARVSLRLGQEAQDVIMREHEIQQGQAILNIINTDPNIKKVKGPARITLVRTDQSGISIEDQANVLTEETKLVIKQDPKLQKYWQLIEINVADGKASLLSARTMLERMEMLQDELNALRLRYQELQRNSGLVETSGSGIIVNMYDADEGSTAGDIIPDYDVRDVVNELFASGATAIQVGNQRIVLGSSIRCVGPVILVNHEPVSVNPVVIKALGDPTTLASGLELIKHNFDSTQRRLEIIKEDNITLTAYQKDK